MTTIDPVRLLRQYAMLLVVCLMVGIGVGVGAYLLLREFTPVYRSQVVYEIREQFGGLTDLTPVQLQRDEYQRFMGTQVQIMTSDAVLQQAVRDINLQQTKWAQQFMVGSGFQPATAAIELQKILSARAVPETRLVTLTASTRSAQDAALIVNAVNAAYIEDMRSRDRAEGSDRRAALGRSITETQQAIRELVARRQAVYGAGNVDDIDVRFTRAAMEVQSATTALTEIRRDEAALQDRLAEYDRLLSDARGVNFPDVVREQANLDPIIRSLDQEIRFQIAGERQLRQQGWGDRHAEVQRIVARIASLQIERQATFEQICGDQFRGLVDASRSQLSALRAQRQDQERQLEQASTRRQQILAAKLEAEQLGEEIKRLELRLEDFQVALKQLESRLDMTAAQRVSVVRRGQIPDKISFPRPEFVIPVFAILIPGLAGGLIVLRELLDQRVRGPQDVGLIPRAKIVGVIPNAADDPSRPANVQTAFRDSPGGAVTEGFRQMRSTLGKRMETSGAKTLVVVGGMPASGATTVASNLAIACASSDMKVLLIDANLRRPSIHKVFKVAEGPGLGDVLTGGSVLEDALKQTAIEHLAVLTAGTASNRLVPERLATESMTALLRQAAGMFDLVIIDTAPAIVSGDGMALANRADAVILVVRALAEKRGLVARLQAQLSDSRAEFMGIVLNAVRPSAGGYFKRNIKETHAYQNHKA